MYPKNYGITEIYNSNDTYADEIETGNCNYSEQKILHDLSRKNVVLLGIPGAGKTTLATGLQLLHPDINYISVGDISRNLPPESTERRYLDKLFQKEAPVGDPAFFLSLIEDQIDNAVSCGQGFILDGIPKKSEEVLPLKAFFAGKNLGIDMVISCELQSHVAYQRLAQRENRLGDDDSMIVYLNRTKMYLDDVDTFKAELVESDDDLIVLNAERLSAGHMIGKLLTVLGAVSS